ncbi:hypothetical protein BS50DRAFT_571475 [Corynespora cassiicola Philippines]|uniref:Uncharacterized protein n=1 Tax=Corynespora cassiicola Philippines TaxID=1448308 RepID=A0A2T2NY36_CORCC|nr:hypothetical protein BS50DRAFT_571475 [Corynespora cassiicola Philippines]
MSSGGRPSLSSEPSVTSSQTLNSRDSGTYDDNGEGSSTQRSSLVEERDFAHPRQRVRRSGGFLLDSNFAAAPRSRQSHVPAAPLADKSKAKRSSRQRSGNGSALQSSPLSREVRVADQGGSNGEVKVAKTRKSGAEPDGAAQAQAIDPNQIIHMALNLSESRRRNLTAGHLVVPQSRVGSVTQQDSSFRGQSGGSSLRQYLNEQRRASRNISPSGGLGSPSGARHMSASMGRSGSMSLQGQSFNPSEATLARRDKAKAYIELKMEYLRLLEFLPPLKPDSTAPGNFIVSANNVPGSPHAQLTRTPSHAGKQHELGRPYNPLQYIRNRRSRARERKTLDHAPEEFLDVHHVRDWVERVENEAKSPRYRHQNGTTMPKFHEDHVGEEGPTKPPRPHMGWVFTPEELLADAHWLEQGDNKTVIEDRYGRKVFVPKELHKPDFLSPRESREYPDRRRKSWVEGLPGASNDPTTGDESEHGSERGRKRRLLPAFRAESPKHKKRGWSSSRPQSGAHSDSSDSDSDSVKNRSRKTRKLPDINDNTGPLELRIREIMENEAREAHSKSPAVASPDTPDKWGVGHSELADHRDSRVSLDVTGAREGSTTTESLQTFKIPPRHRADPSLSVDPIKEDRPSFEEPVSAITDAHHDYKFFSPHADDFSPPQSRDASVSRKHKKSKIPDIFRSDDSTKNYRHERRHDSDLASPEKKHSSRQASEEIEGNGIGTAILAAPSAVKSLLTHRKNESMSSLHSPESEHKKDAKEHKEHREPASAVTRFFKGVKSEGSKVGEFIFRRDRPADDSDSETASSDSSANGSDSDEGSGKTERKTRPTFARSNTAETMGSVTSKKNGRYHLDLPSFRSANHNQSEDENAYATDYSEHHITRQAQQRAKDRPSRFDQLAPPRMDLRSISATSSTSVSRAESPERNRINKVLARAGGVGSGGLPVTPLARLEHSEATLRPRSTSRPTLEGKRHWSITDDNGNVLHRKAPLNVVTASEVARIRALFLCSGIKAREIAQRAHMQRREPASFLIRAAKTANAELIPVKRKEEHVLAARILVHSLEASTQALHNSAEAFRENTVRDLTAMIGELKADVEADVFPRVRDGGDEAVRITSDVSGAAPLAVKQITDEIDRMLRVRRRRMKWIRKVGWMLVEWMLLGVMWWLWFLVVVLGFVKRVFGVGWGVVRWLLWI